MQRHQSRLFDEDLLELLLLEEPICTFFYMTRVIEVRKKLCQFGNITLGGGRISAEESENPDVEFPRGTSNVAPASDVAPTVKGVLADCSLAIAFPHLF